MSKQMSKQIKALMVRFHRVPIVIVLISTVLPEALSTSGRTLQLVYKGSREVKKVERYKGTVYTVSIVINLNLSHLNLIYNLMIISASLTWLAPVTTRICCSHNNLAYLQRTSQQADRCELVLCLTYKHRGNFLVTMVTG